MTGQAVGHLSPLHQPGNKKVSGDSFLAFPLRYIQIKRTLRPPSLSVSSHSCLLSVSLLMSPGDHPPPVVLTLATHWNHRWTLDKSGRGLYSMLGHRLQIHYLIEAWAAVLILHVILPKRTTRNQVDSDADRSTSGLVTTARSGS